MKKKAIELFCCPNCCSPELMVKGDVQDEVRGEIITGQIKCTSCFSAFRVDKRIPRFVPKENYASSFGYQWNIHRKTQLDSWTGIPLSRNRLFAVSNWPERMDGDVILEAGSGAGRFTEVLLGTGATVVSFDLSNAVEANHANNGDNARLHLFQGNIFNLPLPVLSFDKVVCLGVLQHTPDPEKSFQSLAKFVRPGGEIVIDVYAKNWRSLLHWKYLLRPITTRLNPATLYRIVEVVAPPLVPLSRFLRKVGGGPGHRLLPILEYSHWGLPSELNKQWAILDTFDMYSPVHDHPQTLSTVREWFNKAQFIDVFVGYGPNGVIARGRRPNNQK